MELTFWSIIASMRDKFLGETKPAGIINPEDLPESFFLDLSEEELERGKQALWEAVKDLDGNDPNKILYFRRFTREFKSSTFFDPKLTSQPGDNFRYYSPDVSLLEKLPEVELYTASVEVPNGMKVGFVIGYHHLEKPWGKILLDSFERQIKHHPNGIEIILIENKEIPTGAKSRPSESEIQKEVQDRGITHLIDVHEQLSMLNHYMDSLFESKWREGSDKNPNGLECTIDPFVPLWMIEQYYQGNIYPQLQHAINDQLRRVVNLIKEIR